MNFYKHHLGDYDGATAHLSWDEDCAYTRLLRTYYRRELPLPVDVSACCRLVRAVSAIQRRAVQSCLSEFFELRDDGWHNKRADEEISAYQAQSSTNKRIARERWGNDSSTNRTSSVDEASTDTERERTPNQNQNQNQNQSKPKPLVADATVEQFEIAWKHYPKRSGNNPKADALRAWRARIAEKVDPALMLAGLSRYAKWCEATGKVGTETVMQAVRFFGKSRPFEQAFDPPTGGGNGSGKFDPIRAGRELHERHLAEELAAKNVDRGAVSKVQPDLLAEVHDVIPGDKGD